MGNEEIIPMTKSEIDIEEAYAEIDKVLVNPLLDSEIIDIKVALGKLILKARAEERKEKQEQVRKLKDEIKNAYRDDIDCALIPRSDVQDMINKIFPDCADDCLENKFCAKHGVTHIKEELV